MLVACRVIVAWWERVHVVDSGDASISSSDPGQCVDVVVVVAGADMVPGK